MKCSCVKCILRLIVSFSMVSIQSLPIQLCTENSISIRRGLESNRSLFVVHSEPVHTFMNYIYNKIKLQLCGVTQSQRLSNKPIPPPQFVPDCSLYRPAQTLGETSCLISKMYCVLLCCLKIVLII